MRPVEKPRFEFRSFGKDFSLQAKKMKQLSGPVPKNVRTRKSKEIYIISITNDIANTKIRDDKIDTKRLIQTKDSLEQWEPVTKTGFPVLKEYLLDQFFPSLSAISPILYNNFYSVSAFIKIIDDHEDLCAIRVSKERFGYIVNQTICEVANVTINNTRVVTISSESIDSAAVKKTLIDIGLESVENINYLQAIKRVSGIINKSLAN
ncbi:uncharacterized protein METZ01_LOCUS202928 [marine metagenome]|uniref:Uncharacterized protein n=1 Tax=marine metagenome TaxID=408172 RepID=A0A382EJ35_9ZZZZ